jgi:hypothetical protein
MNGVLLVFCASDGKLKENKIGEASRLSDLYNYSIYNKVKFCWTTKM